MPLAAVGQFCATSSLSANLAACTHLLRLARDRGASALFLPEASDYIATSPSESLSLCQPVTTSPFVLGLQAEAKKLALPINVGIHEPCPTSAEKIRNMSVWIDANGNITQRYQKVHTFDVFIAGGPQMQESKTTEPGSALMPPFQTPVGKVGLLVCFDLRFPEPSLALRRNGAEVVTYPSAFTVPTGQAHWEVLLRARAIETQAYVVAAAQIGRHSEGRASYGQSMIVDPWGRIVAQCRKVEVGEEPRTAGEVEPEICVAEVDLGMLEKMRKEVPLKRRFDVYPEV
ncbi:uncharacterized protein LAJ45_07702 [Morchella importuna]|uniref:uncharacterized protein n=1 Tax=Morchella importuna TaxID=1174673 RepID=UPI001E8CF783|nr:uncharacterized protein LAJ45_07702 [Morchella importuna]KAH8148250.1 hypothetical protein LAJ45_07702 [Morchella importuna]